MLKSGRAPDSNGWIEYECQARNRVARLTEQGVVTVAQKRSGKFRIDKIHIKNYKCIDSLEMDFPGPMYSGQYDICALGSKNGVGKTSVLECCALAFAALRTDFHSSRKLNLSTGKHGRKIHNVADFLVKSGEKKCFIKGYFTICGRKATAEISLDSSGIPTVKATGIASRQTENANFTDFVENISGFSANPVAGDKFVFIHGYRKVQGGGIDTKYLVTPRDESNGIPICLPDFQSSFKESALLEILSESSLLNTNADGTIYTKFKGSLDELLKKYAGISMKKIRIDDQDNNINIRVEKDGSSFSIDALSSGQKEVLSIIFTIAVYASSDPTIVIIDDLELHLNSRWHKTFIHDIVSGFPKNQYIIATHSPHLMNAIPDEQTRVLSMD